MSLRRVNEDTRASRRHGRDDDRLEPWNPRETESASAARFFGIVGMVGPVVTWAYVGLIVVRDHATDHGQRYLLQVFGSLSDLLLVPSLIAVGLGLASILRRGVSPAWRRRASLGLVLGILGIAATTLRLVIAAHSG
jgi:hypothetical protein